MTDLYTGAGLSGIDEHRGVGWPYHGAVFMQPSYELNDSGTGFIENNPIITYSQLAGRGRNNGNYFVDVINISGEWSYFALHSSEYGSLPPYGSISKGEINYRVAADIIGAGPWDVGLPLMTPSGRYLNFNVLISVDGKNIITTSRPRLFSYTLTGVTTDTHPIGVTATTHDFDGCKSYFSQITGTGTQSPTYYVPASEINKCRFSCRILDYKKDRVLVAISNSALSLDSPTGEFVLGGQAACANYRYNEVGYTASNRHSDGFNVVCIYEIILTGETAEDVTVHLIKTPKQCEGSVSRVSPTETTTVADESSPVVDATKVVYECSVSQTGAVLDAHYSSADNTVIYTLCDVAHSVYAEHSGQYKGVLWQQRVEYNSSMTLGGVTKSYKQETSHVFDMPEGWSPDTPELGDPFVKITNKIFENEVLVIDETFTPKNHDLIVRPVSFNALTGRRAPFAGPDARVGQYGFGYGYPGYDNIFNMRFYSMAMRNNGSGTCVMYGVIDSFGIQSSLNNIKIVSDCTVVSSHGVKTISGFIDTVAYNDPRYTLKSGNTVFRYHAFRGYIGAMLKGSVNKKTGEYYAAPITNPTSYTYWL